mmetsp:Transcript_26325/g.72363  ORF Transcript_26325/g.72363 Transcript_26325/m.72363 type:complete len:267 (-) Transcript_26325:2610-3410(-)
MLPTWHHSHSITSSADIANEPINESAIWPIWTEAEPEMATQTGTETETQMQTVRMAAVAVAATILDTATATNRSEEEGATGLPCLLDSAGRTMDRMAEVVVAAEAGTRITVVEEDVTTATTITVGVAPIMVVVVAGGEEEEDAVDAIPAGLRTAAATRGFAVDEEIGVLPTTATATIAVVVVGGDNKSSWASTFKPWWTAWFARGATFFANSESPERATWPSFNRARPSRPSSPTWRAGGICASPTLFGIGSITSGSKRIPFTTIR